MSHVLQTGVSAGADGPGNVQCPGGKQSSSTYGEMLWKTVGSEPYVRVSPQVR